MAEKMWGAEPFWGLSYDWDPDWVLTDRQKELRDTLIGLCEKEMRANAKRSDDELLYPRRNLELMGEHGFLALTVPEEYGGLGENHVAFAMTCETIARYGCASTAMCYVMHMAAVQTLMLRPTPELIEKYIRPLNSGKLGTLSYSDPETGSHFWYPFSSKAERANGGYKVNKKASWTTSGGFADFYVVQTTSPDFTGYDDLSVFVIDGEHVKAQPSLWDALGLRGNQSGPIQVEGVEIPGDQIVGPEGDGATSNDEAVDPWFLIGSSSVWNGIALGAIDIAARHTTRKRHVDVGMRVADYPTIQDYVGEAVMDTNACRLFVLSVCQAFDWATDDNTRMLEPGQTARADFLHWAWQIKFEAAKNVAHVRRQDAARLRRVGLQARHGARALRARRQGRLGDGPDERGAAPVRRQGRAARLRGARLLEPELQPPRGRERGQEARPGRQARARRAADRAGREGRGEPAGPAHGRIAPSAVLLTPGLKPVDPSFESWWVRPGGATRVRVRPDDRLTVIDPDGGQPAELVVLGADPEALGVRPDAPATVLAGAGWCRRTRARSGCSAPTARPARAQSFVARSEAAVVVAAPGGRVVDGDWPASALVVELQRAEPRRARGGRAAGAAGRAAARLPRRQGLRALLRGREGEYIQIIDVAGRQCSDFLAFHAHKLDAGVERGLDPQVTRTLMGTAYPTVGLHSKYYDADMDPLCQVVQDTVGRHDSFALACTARYYEDLGYPGHVNCTENFNRQLDPYGIAPKKGWAALNFFYNTSFDPDLVLLSDEPWSRPGDFVLLRAMSDLVCASSACPDDIDPANGWEVTDVHVRVYSPENRFSMAIAHRVTPEAEPVLTKETGFHPRWSQLTRNVTEYRGYWLPTCFTNEGAVAEYWACREKAAVMDLSPLRKWEILGPDAEALMQHAVTRDIRRLADGQVVYTAVCNETGGMVDDATVFRLGDDNFRFVGGDEYDGVHLKQLAERLGLDRVWIKPTTDQLHNLAVQGPLSREILREIIWSPDAQPKLDELKLVPLPDRPDRRLRRDPGDRLADRLQRRARLRGVVPPVRRPGGLGRDHGGRRAARAEAARARRARHAADRVGADLRRLRVRRPGRPVRGGDRVHGRARHRGRLLRQGGAGRAQGAPAAHAGRARAGGQRDRRARRLRARAGRPLAGRRDHVRARARPTLRKNVALCRMAVQYAELGHRGRGRQARRAPEADPGDGRALPVLRPGEEAPAVVTGGAAERPAARTSVATRCSSRRRWPSTRPSCSSSRPCRRSPSCSSPGSRACSGSGRRSS